MSLIYITKTPSSATLHDTLDGAMTEAMNLYSDANFNKDIYVLKVEQCESIKIELVDRIKKGE
jgi:hypothetical protein